LADFKVYLIDLAAVDQIGLGLLVFVAADSDEVVALDAFERLAQMHPFLMDSYLLRINVWRGRAGR
jgi:hypothetical protein